MKRRRIAIVCLALVAATYFGGRWLLLRWATAAFAGKPPRTALGTVLKKEHVRLSDKQETVKFPSGTSITMKDERFHVYYRIDDFYDIDPAGRAAVLRREQARFTKEGPRHIQVAETEFTSFAEGGKITVQYAYYPSAFWGVSDDIRIPW